MRTTSITPRQWTILLATRQSSPASLAVIDAHPLVGPAGAGQHLQALTDAGLVQATPTATGTTWAVTQSGRDLLGDQSDLTIMEAGHVA